MFGCTCSDRNDGFELILPSGEVITVRLRVVFDRTDINPVKIAVRIQAPKNARINRLAREQYQQFGPQDCIIKPPVKPSSKEGNDVSVQQGDW
jgi:hypothetical protein